MKKLLTELNIGIAKPIKVIHFSDTHLTRADGRDDERKIELCKGKPQMMVGIHSAREIIIR